MKHTVFSWIGIALAVLACLGAHGVRADGVASYVYVATNGNDTTGTGTIDNPYLTPSNGIAHAYATTGKDTVFLKAGTYEIDTALTLDAALTLKGEDRATTIIKQTATVASGQGRVVTISSADVRVESLWLRNGFCSASGGCLFMSGGVVTNCIISNGTMTNRDGTGGNVHLSGGTITHCVIRDSAAGNNYGHCGAGVAVSAANVTIDTCLILNNDCVSIYTSTSMGRGKGGGIYVVGDYANVVVQNCTVAGNTASHGAGIYSTGSKTLVRNCIFSDNVIKKGHSSNVPQDPTSLGYPNMSAAKPTDWVSSVSNVVVSSGTAIAETARVGDPLFVGSGDYHIGSEDSPAVEYGQAYDGQCGDLEGKARKAKPDCGCYESDYTSSVVEQEFTSIAFTPAGGLIGTNVTFTAVLKDPPEDETFDVTWKMIDAYNGEIALAGTTLSFGENINTCGNFLVECSVQGRKNPKRTGTKQTTTRLRIVTPVQYVNCKSKKPTFPYDAPERAATEFTTVIDELLDGVTLYVAAGTYGVGKTASIGDVRIFGESATNTILSHSHSADFSIIAMNDARACVSNVTLSGGYGTGGGARINANGGTLTHCRVTASSATAASSGTSGLGVYCNSADGLIDTCLIDTNTVFGYYGDRGDACGVVYLDKGTMRNSIVNGNTVMRNKQKGYEGVARGIVYVGAEGIVENCTIADNVDPSADAWTLYVADGGQVVNTIVANNSTPNMTTTGELYGLPNWRIEKAAAASGVSNCCVGVSTALGTDCRRGDPLFVDSTNENYRLQKTSPCRNRGQWQAWMSGATDFYGTNRIFGARVDIGAAECQSTPGLVLFVR